MALTGVGIDTSAIGGVKSNEGKEFDSVLGKDAFLQLLAVEMSNQDPLEPTSNTEYISQLAQFSALEAMQNLETTNLAGQAMSLTGSYVIMNTTDSAGNEKQISGIVDFVTVKDGKAYLTINGKEYSFDDFDSVVDPNYVLQMLQNEKDSANGSANNEGGTANSGNGDNTGNGDGGGSGE
ncbi:MAG: hypothetical protein K2G89_09875 [Lachnospiraceae bacterium]|nr:hypothetical protein [Lachnospiraceae bacterium]